MVELIVEAVLWFIFFRATGILPWSKRRPPPDFPLLEKDWAVKTADDCLSRKKLPGRPCGAVTLYLLGWIDAYEMEELLDARIAKPKEKMTPKDIGIELDYKLVNKGHKVLHG